MESDTRSVRGRILARPRRSRAKGAMAGRPNDARTKYWPGSGEMDKGITLIDWFAGERLKTDGHTAPSELPKPSLYLTSASGRRFYLPWNFPGRSIWKISPALVAKNTVIFNGFLGSRDGR